MPEQNSEEGPGWFDLDRPLLDGNEHFEIVPRSGGGWVPFSAALSRLLIRCTERGLWWATLHLDDSTRPFAHLGPDEGGRLWTEVAGNHSLPADQQLDEAAHDRLAALGWNHPLDEDGMRNWHRSWEADVLALACDQFLTTLAAVYGFDEGDVIHVEVQPFR